MQVIAQTVSTAGDQLAKACQMLIIGVGFQRDGRTWDVYSCWGDDLGSLSTHMVGSVNRFMKQQGHVGLHGHPDYTLTKNGLVIPTVTFSRCGWEPKEMEALLEESFFHGHLD